MRPQLQAAPPTAQLEERGLLSLQMMVKRRRLRVSLKNTGCTLCLLDSFFSMARFHPLSSQQVSKEQHVPKRVKTLIVCFALHTFYSTIRSM
mmetsp:Transcript_18608/g.25800  ORF Transcript_18608/g.25800 Transcript_18608/m.25800 type:complete len:92 (-) Transcript_18608:177-452(-)